MEVWGAALGGEIPDTLPAVLATPPFDLGDEASVRAAIEVSRPHMVFHLAAQSSVSASWRDPLATADITGAGTARMLEAVRSIAPDARVFVASSSEIFGAPEQVPTDESSPVRPVSPYGSAKAFGHHLVRAYRDGFGMFVCSGILFNHESPLRGAAFVTGKIVAGAVAIANGEQDELVLGNLDVRRDWCFAGDVTRAMAMMLSAPQPDDYIVASGVSHSVAEWCELAFAFVGLDWRRHVRSDPALMRPGEVMEQRGNPARARHVLGWSPEVEFPDLVRMMVDAERERRIAVRTENGITREEGSAG